MDMPRLYLFYFISLKIQIISLFVTLSDFPTGIGRDLAIQYSNDFRYDIYCDFTILRFFWCDFIVCVMYEFNVSIHCFLLNEGGLMQSD